jgi:hypothetical protein
MATALYYAVRHHQTYALQQLLKVGAKINIQNKWGQTPLCVAVVEINPVAVRLLLEKGADPNIVATAGHPLLYTVCSSADDDTEIAQMLIKAGANVSVPAPDYGITPLMRACDYSRWHHLNLLLRCKADPNQQDKAGRTALMYALQSDGRDTYTYAMMRTRVRLLVEHGADVNLEDNSGQTALDYAARAGVPDMVVYLSQHGAQRVAPRFPRWQFSTNVTSEIRQRAVAATTPLLAWEGGEFGCIGGTGNRGRDHVKNKLGRNWSVHDRDDFSIRLEQLRRQSDTTDYAQLLQMSPEDVRTAAGNNPAQCIRAMTLQCERLAGGSHFPRPEDDAILAWDLIRYMHLCGIGMTIRYLKEDEGWQRIEEAETLLEKRFASWDEVAASFRLGQKLYDVKDTPDYDEICKLLNNRDDPNHPWKRVAWKMRSAQTTTTSYQGMNTGALVAAGGGADGGVGLRPIQSARSSSITFWSPRSKNSTRISCARWPSARMTSSTRSQ